MNLYKLNQINNSLDHRLIDLFVLQNQQNRWLTVGECACWVFQTNKPNTYHKTYTQNKLTSLVGSMGTKVRATSAFEMLHKPNEIGRFVFRLKDPSAIKSQSGATVRDQINSVYTSTSVGCIDREECCLDELEF